MLRNSSRSSPQSIRAYPEKTQKTKKGWVKIDIKETTKGKEAVVYIPKNIRSERRSRRERGKGCEGEYQAFKHAVHSKGYR